MGQQVGARGVIGRAAGGWVMTRPEHGLLVLGPPRSGKTRGVVAPNVLAASGPVVSTSTKTDVLALTLGRRRSAGRCWLYDPTGTVEPPPGVEPLRWSLVDAADDWDDAVRATSTLVGTVRDRGGDAVHWAERAEALLAPVLHAAALAEAGMASVVESIHRRRVEPARSVLEAAGASQALDLLMGVAATEEREQSGIWSTAAGALAGYRTAAALRTTEAPNFDPADFVGSPDTVYICAPGQHQREVAPLVAGLVDRIRAARYGLESGPHLLLALDEAANIAPLPELPALVSEGGGQGVLTLACFQDLSQARARWGRAADGFMTTFGAKLVLPGVADGPTLEALSRLCGDQEVRVASISRRGLRRSRGWSTRRQARLSPEEIRRGRPGAALLVDTDAPAGWVLLATPSRAREAGISPAPGRDRGAGAQVPGRAR
ncbi:MAG: type IV secretory system conjugative DNA transfer family protein [Acidimicrobiales bacterium]